MKPLRHIPALLCVLSVAINVAALGRGMKKIDPVESYLKLHDKNKDGSIDKTESPMSAASFDKADKNHDGKLSKEELAEALHMRSKAPAKKKKESSSSSSSSST
jgi:hypothetical protein